MNTQSRIESLQRELRALARVQVECSHNFGDPYQAIEEKNELTYESVCTGSDVYPMATGSRVVKTKVWKRKCSLCGLIQTTNRMEPVVQSYRPVF